ncbi:unnamed protein product [Cuscuta epithymum]|uniref:Uncharacterized protein n=2 Tax=Cuscuta epithymum TaxID=186058 RepID=A0AAV0CAF8_9ASTE|nr:unnamed protein product [Cuscuta epithymum]
MQNFEEGEEVFFDSSECLSFEEPVWEQGDRFGYDIWLNELHSVKERRENFFCKMGTTSEFKFTSGRIHDHHLQDAVCSSSSLSTSSSSSIGEEGEDLKCGVGRDCSLDDANCLVDDDLSTSCPAMKTKKSKWWKPFLHKLKGGHSCKPGTGGFLKVRPSRKKKFMELTGLYGGQEIKGHTGVIRTMKFSPNGQYLASGGEDGMVRVWRVLLAPASDFFKSELGRGKKWGVEIPEKVFQIEESPVHEFYGHTSAVLDLAWSSTTNSLLSSSKDNTVRLWKVGSDECHGVFHHNNYVTCIQFNPIDEDLFISGCIDGKARVWRVTDKRVAEWADIHDIVTAICYQPNGKGFIVGSISGVCHFYQTGSELYLDAEIQFGGRRRSTSNIITGIQFLPNGSQKVMITSGDSRIRILDGHEVVCKYRGPRKSGNHTSPAHATPNGKHVISIGEDSQVYLWNYEDRRVQDPKQVKSERSFEHFISERASIAIPWVGESSSQMDPSPPRIWADSERFSLGNWFSTETSSRVSVTWPEEVLPLYNVPTPENGDNHVTDHDHDDEDGHLRSKLVNNNTSRSPAWGLVIVTAGLDGRIRTFHNYGLPVRV